MCDRSFDMVLSSPMRSGGAHNVGLRKTSQLPKKAASEREIDVQLRQTRSKVVKRALNR